ncbi:Uncharacterised protein [Vibrio cholerae]|nr:Uncharacterised protein [Vibrio cholerae]CSI93178.1 Uncharacterised protein [Vibrio cholerae]
MASHARYNRIGQVVDFNIFQGKHAETDITDF